jgi:hypothetical protein
MPVHDGCRWKGTKPSERQSTKLYLSTGSTEGPKDPSTAGYRDELDAVATIGQYPVNGYCLKNPPDSNLATTKQQ